MKRSFFAAVLALLCITSVGAFAKARGDYVYRSRANWVKLTKLSNKQLAGVTLKHPNEDITAAQLEGMLLSLKMNKGSLLKKDIKELDVFTIDEAKKYASYIVDALRRAQPNQVVNVSVIQQRPYFILKSDYLSMMNVFVTEEGVHFYFSKLFAKLDSDYEQASKMDRAISKARGIRVSLEPQAGQQIVGDADELIMAADYDFANNVHRKVPVEREYKAADNDEMAVSTKRAKAKKSRSAKAVRDDNVGESGMMSQDTESRLRKLDELKRQKLVTDAEYKAKRAEILGSI